MNVNLDVLRAALVVLLDHVERSKGKDVLISDDLYWFVSKMDLNDVTSVPTELTLGSTFDDWKNVSAIGRNEKEPIGYALVWTSSLIRALGAQTI